MSRSAHRKRSSLAAERQSTDSNIFELSKTELLKKLNTFSEILKELGQDDRPEGLRETAIDLARPELLQHKDRDVRQLVSCCLVDILRVYAPQAPYSPGELRDIFGLLTQQLRGLSEAVDQLDPRSSRVHYILHSLACFKSCVILVELSREGIDGSYDALIDFFECLLTGIHTDHLQEVVDDTQEALAVCLDELEENELTQPLLDALLMGLLPVTKSENLKSYQLTQSLLRRCYNRVFMPITAFINGVITGNTRGVQGAQSELVDHVKILIMEIHQVNPQMLLYILPTLAQQLQSADVEVRLDSAFLLGRLFSSSHAEYGEQFAPVWADFLGRFKDLDAKVRKCMVSRGVEILQRKPSLRPPLQEALILRLSDPDSEVRTEAVHLLCDSASNSLDAVSASLFRAIGERLRDKKTQLRKDAATGLAQIYSKNISKRWSEGSFPNIHQPANEIVEKLDWIPTAVIKCYAYKDSEIRLRVIQLLDDILLPIRETVQIRSAGMICLWRNLDQGAKKGIRTLLDDRRRCRELILDYTTTLLVDKKASTKSPIGPSEKLKEIFQSIIELVPTPDGRVDTLQKLHDHKDRKVFMLLKSLCDNKDNKKDPALIREDVIQRVGTKTVLGSYMAALTRYCALLSLGPDMLHEILNACSVALSEGNKDIYEPGLDLLGVQIGIFPNFTLNKIDRLIALYEEAGDVDDAPFLQTSILKLMSCRIAPNTTCEVSLNFKKALQSAIVLKGVPFEPGFIERSEASVQAMKALLSEDDPIPERTLTELVERTTRDPSESLLGAALASLRMFALLFPSDFDRYATVLTEFVGERILNKDAFTALLSENSSTLKGKKGHKKSKSNQMGCAPFELITAGLRLLTARVLPLPLNVENASRRTNSLDEKVKKEIEKLLGTLFGISSVEDVLADWELKNEEKVEIRLCASICILNLMRNKRIQSFLDPKRWHLLAWTLCNEDETVRERFAKEISRAVNEGSLPPRFVAYLALVGGENEGVKRESRAALSTFINAARRAHSRKIAQVDTPEVLEKISIGLPEYIIPYSLHLLAHMPGVGNISEDGVGSQKVQKCLNFIIQSLLDGQDTNGDPDNIAFLLQILSTIRSSYTDALSPDSDKLHAVVDIARSILHAKIKTPESLQPYPGQIFLPSPLFSRKISREKMIKTPLSNAKNRIQTTKTDEKDQKKNDSLRESPDWGSPITRASKVSAVARNLHKENPSLENKNRDQIVAGSGKKRLISNISVDKKLSKKSKSTPSVESSETESSQESSEKSFDDEPFVQNKKAKGKKTQDPASSCMKSYDFKRHSGAPRTRSQMRNQQIEESKESDSDDELEAISLRRKAISGL